ncbi:hypothetical protein IJD44_01475 [bacterium]|nr:hypothetical protein [bacterium]
MSVSRINSTSVSTTENKKPEKKSMSQKTKTAIIAGTVLASAAACAGIIVGIKKGKININRGQNVAGDTISGLKKIKFNNGTALNSDGSKFTGIIEDTLKNGDKISLEYTDGILKKSTRSGSKNFEKVFKYDANKLQEVATKEGASLRRFVKTENGHQITEDNKLIKKMYIHKNNIVVNDFDKESGIIKQSINFDNNKKTKEIIKSDALDKLKIAQSKNSKLEKSAIIESETWESGALKKAKFEDGTIKKYDKEGHVIFEQKPNGETSQLRKYDRFASDREEITFDEFGREFDDCVGVKNRYALDFPNGHTKYYDNKGTLRKEKFPDGTSSLYYADGTIMRENVKKGDILVTNEYYPSGQIKYEGNITGGKSIWYRKDGTISDFWKDENHSIVYKDDGITKKYESFLDGSTKEYNN